MRKSLPNSSDCDGLAGSRILILSGKYEGQEGVCLGRSARSQKWAVSPDSATEILELEFEAEFALLLDLSDDPKNN